MDSSTSHRKAQPRRRTTTTSSTSSSWCCSFKSPPKSPETLYPKTPLNHPTKKKNQSLDTLYSKSLNSFPSSPQSSKSGLSVMGRIDPRRILSPGRVSPIDSDPTDPLKLSNLGPSDPAHDPDPDVGLGEGLGEGEGEERENEGSECECECEGEGCEGEGEEGMFDLRLSLKGKNGGGCLVLELNSKVLGDNSSVFARLIGDCRKGLGNAGGFCRIEVPEVENLGVFRETIELMFEEDVSKRLIKVGAYRAIDILEVSASIKFNRGIFSCLKYLEAVPWTEEEEEKLRRLFTKFKFDDATSNEIFSRLNLPDSSNGSPQLATQLVQSITNCSNTKARNELKTMVKGLLSKSSVYEKDQADISKEDLYSVSQSCILSLVTLFQQASSGSTIPSDEKKTEKSLIELVSWQVDNLTWLLEILLDRHVGEDFVDVWARQDELLAMHADASPMVRYELSRVSAALFVAMGTRRLQCRAGSRVGILNAWFGPMLVDFGWLQRCRKGLDVRELEEAMGQALLTLPLKQQYGLFMEWFRCFSKHGTECPNLSKAFQIWWRRSFLRGSETHAIESR